MKFPGGLGDILQQAQQLQQNMSEVKAELEKKTVEASAGGGMVTIVANGAFEVLSVRIDPSVLTGDDVEMVQDLVQAAANEALRKAKELMKEEMSKLTGGLPIPGL